MEKTGKVFLDDNLRPFYIVSIGGQKWLHYWHPDKMWVSLRPIKENEIFPDNLTEEEQEMYFL
ncbi:MAG: hypothetical protein PHV11_09115 [Candidatus Bipolaricaulis sp.]|nr:hypothetical protein [Candidatus Bipolaricaulis sp.]